MIEKTIEIFPWDSSFETGIKEIDHQHKKLVEIINDLATKLVFSQKRIDLDQIFKELIDYARYHFKTEEAIWSHHLGNHPSYEKHQKTHSKFTTHIKMLLKELENKPIKEVIENALGFLTEWLVSHILESDRHLAYVILALENGENLDEAISNAKEKMEHDAQRMIHLIKKIYSSLTNNTLSLMRELVYEQELENRVQSNEKLFRTVIDEIPDAVVLKDHEGNFLLGNKFVANLYKTTPEEMIGKHDGDFGVPKKLSDFFRKNVLEIMEKGETSVVYEDSADANTGKIRHFKSIKKPFKNEKGENRILVIAHDVTDLIRTEKELKESKKQLDFVLQGAKAVTWKANLQTGKISFSSNDFFGQSANNVDSYEKWFACVHEDDTKKAQESIQKLIDGEKESSIILRFCGIDGNYSWLEGRSIAGERDENGNLVTFMGITYDITQEKEKELELLRQKEMEYERYKNFIETSQDGIILYDFDGNVLEANNRQLDMLGYTLDELKKLQAKDWDVNYSSKAVEELNEIIRHQSIEFETLHKRKDGSLYNALVSAGTLQAAGKEFIFSSTRDVTKQKEIEEEFINAKKRAEDANQFKSQFLANMSHEIRTPMTAIFGFLEQLRRGEKDPQRLKLFETIQDSSQTLMSIINDILDFSKIESGKMELETHRFNLRELLQNSVQTFSNIAKNKEINLSSSLDANIPIYSLGDDIRFKQVLFNLLNNAIKFTQSGGNITLDVEYNNNKELLKVAIIDTGIGIAKNNIKAIFEAFKQEDSSTTRKFGGTGLGLSICSKLIALMGGELKVKSVLGKGSTFSFEIPLQKCEPEQNGSTGDSSDKAAPKHDVAGAHVLVVEDNKTNQMLLSLILDEIGVTFEIAHDGTEAIVKYKNSDFDVVLMDENMPNMNGIEATHHIRELEIELNLKPVPIIAVTANALSSDRERFLDAGMNDYVAKPYSQEDIINILALYA